MNEENSRKIYEAAPTLFKRKVYLACGDGWFQLILELVDSLERILRSHYETYGEDEFFEMYVTQIKEKYGTLSFYMSTATEEMYNLIELAEERSTHICEVCGADGELNNHGGWLSVRCKICP